MAIPTEAALTTRFKKTVERDFPRAVWTKHADASVRSVPDVSIVGARGTMWVEIKVLRPGDTLAGAWTPAQRERARRIARMRPTDAWLLVYDYRDPASPVGWLLRAADRDALAACEDRSGTPIREDVDATVARTLLEA